MPASPSAAAASIGRGRLTRDFRALGLRRGQDLLVHCSMRTIGWIDGGPATLLGALQEAAGPAATIVVPAMTTVNSFSSSAFLAETRGLTEPACATLHFLVQEAIVGACRQREKLFEILGEFIEEALGHSPAGARTRKLSGSRRLGIGPLPEQ